MFQRVKDWLLDCNYRRLLRRKQKRLQCIASDCSAESALCDNTGVWPRKVHSVLLVDPLHCFGDSLYVNALLHRLLEDTPTLEVTLLTEAHLFDVYRQSGCDLKDYRSPQAVADAAKQSFDLILDLDYKDDNEWDFRRSFYGGQKACVVTLSPVVNQAKIFTGWLDLKDVVHFGQRMGMVAQLVKSMVAGQCHMDADKRMVFSADRSLLLKPCIDGVTWHPENLCIYVNTQGSKAERNFSDGQVKSLAAWFNGQKKYVGLFYLGKEAPYAVDETEQVKLVRTKTFMEAVRLAVSSRGIVSPDTSMVHVASATDTPLLAVYAVGKREYPSGRDQSEVWAPVGDQTIIYAKKQHTVGELPSSELLCWFKKFVVDISKNDR